MIVIAFIGILCLHFRTKTWLSGAIVGFLWASSVGHWYSSWQLANRYFNENIVLEGTVQTLQIQLNMPPEINTFRNTLVYDDEMLASTGPQKFVLKLSKAGKSELWHMPKVRLSWFSPSFRFQEGDHIRLVVKLKKPNALANTGRFNRLKWMASQNIIGVGTVRNSPSNTVLQVNTSLRQTLLNRYLRYSERASISNTRWILALAMGERSLLEKDDWTLLQTSGTAHLFAISGLHLGIVSLIVFNCAQLLWVAVQRYFGKKQVNSMPIALVFSVLACIFYAYISGFQLPVVRALLALIFITLLINVQAHWRPFTVLLYLFLGFLLLFPLSILSMSFWFSFGAILFIYVFIWRFPKTQRSAFSTLKQLLALQLFLSLAMLPIVMMNFMMISTISALVNIIVMPFVSIILVPMCLLLVVLLLFDWSTLIDPMLTSIDFLFEQLMLFMRVCQSLPYAHIALQHFSALSFCLSYLLLILLCLPYWPGRKRMLATLGIAWLLVNTRNEASNVSWSVRILDIGQGLSVLISQGDRAMLYDTGQSFMNGGSYASSVIAPYFLSSGNFSGIDYLINSHMDNDHAGGNAFVFAHIEVGQWLTPASGCTANDNFMWGKLRVDILWPTQRMSGDHNNHSCVVKISDGRNSVLLTGDIEKAAEQALVQQYAHHSTLKADVMLAPHHGSKTSSSIAFINRVSPHYVVVSSKYQNQWGFPHPTVVDNVRQANALLFNTAYDGDIVFDFSDSGFSVSAYRRGLWSPWYMKIY